MAYSGRAEQIFHQALLRAFDRATLEQFVVVNLDIELENVTRRGNFSDEVWDLVRWADRSGRLKELVEKAASEVPANPQLKDAVKQVRDPELIEDRWFARFVPLATWLVRVMNVLLLVALVKVWMVNLVDTTQVLLIVTLVTVVLYLGWMLYQRLIGGPVRTLAGILLLRRLVAHSRLTRRDWRAFAVALAVAASLGALVQAAPKPVRASFERGNVKTIWKGSDFVVRQRFPASKTMAPQNLVSDEMEARDRFAPTYYRVELYAGSFNTARDVTVRIELIHPDARDLNDERARQPSGVTFLDVALDRALNGVLNERVPGSAADERVSIVDRAIRISLSLEQLKGRHTVLFTCQRALDAQPNASEVVVYVQLEATNGRAVLAFDRGGSKINEWDGQMAAHRGGGRSVLRASLQRAGPDALRLPGRDALLRLPVGRAFPT